MFRIAAERTVLDALRPGERFAYAVGAQLNETPLGKRFSMLWGNHVAQPGLALTINDRLILDGAEHLPKRSMILAANHRTWFDLYATLIATWDHYPKPPFLYCPVRSEFHYDGPLGVALNLLVSGNSMYPPIFRDDRGSVLNRYAVDACVRLLAQSERTVIAMHPEGKRNKNPDPYAFLPAKSGIGRIALRSQAPVVPVFVAGLPPTFKELVALRLKGGAEPVRVTLGAPVELSDLYDQAEVPGAHKQAAQRVMSAIAACGERDRAFITAWREKR